MCDPNHTREPCVQIYFLPHFLTCRVRIVDILFVDIFCYLLSFIACGAYCTNSAIHRLFYFFFALPIVAHLFHCIICSNALFLSPPARFFHLQTIIIKNNLHLLLFFIVCFSVSYTRLRTEFLFIHLLGDVFCIFVRSFCFTHIHGFVCTFAVGIVQKCHCFHASECVEMCSWCGVERSLANCANIIKSIL